MMKPTNQLVNPMLTDYYQITMAYAYWKAGVHEEEAVFDLFFRKNPFGGEFAIYAGLSEKLRLFESFLLRGGSIHEAGSPHEERVEVSFHFCHLASVRLDGQVDAAIQLAHTRSILRGALAGRPG